MATLIEHILKLSDHRDRDLLELTVAKALVDLLRIQRVVVAKVMVEEGERRWLEAATLDAKGGGKVTDPLRVDFKSLKTLDDAKDRLTCIQTREPVEIAWAGPDGPRITYFPLYADTRSDEQGVIEVHSGSALAYDEVQIIEQLRHIYRSMYTLLEYSDRDPLTGLLNRKSLDDAFYSAILAEFDGVQPNPKTQVKDADVDAERRHRLPPNYWLGMVGVDNFGVLSDKNGHLIAEEVLLLVARVLNNTFRTHDRIYRFGGEYFVVLFFCPDESQALGAFERLRANIEKFNFPQAGRVTVSAGFTNILTDDSPSTALERTEQALVFAQKNGRNRVCSHLELVRKGLYGEVARVGSVDVF
jgi:diguanylate cyclase (GGDEF)-like protein